MTVDSKIWIRLAMGRIAEAQRYLSEVDWDSLEGKEPGTLGSVRVYLNEVLSKLKEMTQ